MSDNRDDNPDNEMIPVRVDPELLKATTPERQPRRTTRGNPLSIVTPSAADILHGSDGELRVLARRVGQAERAAARQTERARELLRRLNKSEPSLNYRAENKRLRADLHEMKLLASIYAAGYHDLGDTLSAIVFPERPYSSELPPFYLHHFGDNPEKLAEAKREREQVAQLSLAARRVRRYITDPERLIREFTERAEERAQYIYDMRGHRVRKDMVDANSLCAECHREIARENAAKEDTG